MPATAFDGLNWSVSRLRPSFLSSDMGLELDHPGALPENVACIWTWSSGFVETGVCSSFSVPQFTSRGEPIMMLVLSSDLGKYFSSLPAVSPLILFCVAADQYAGYSDYSELIVSAPICCRFAITRHVDCFAQVTQTLTILGYVNSSSKLRIHETRGRKSYLLQIRKILQ